MLAITDRQTPRDSHVTVREMIAECHSARPIHPARAAWFHTRLRDGITICDSDAAQLERWEHAPEWKLKPSPGYDYAAARRRLQEKRAAFHAAAASLDAKPRFIPEREA
jgi:hypothetical protein